MNTIPANTRKGMPGGLPFIVVNEAAERYSFYGMRSILTVFMTRYLLDASGQADAMTDSDALIWYHTFTMGVYFLPIFGALLADIFLGKYRTIMVLSLVYCLGHLVLALDHTRLGLSMGLALIAIGAGGIKPCVSAHLGDQFDSDNSYLLDRAYAWFYFAINIGAVVSMFLGEAILARFGPHLAFGIPGGLMLLATIVFYLGRKRYRTIPPVGWKAFRHTLSAGETRKAILRILPVFGLVAVFWSLYDQTGSSWVLQAQSSLMDKDVGIFGRTFTLLASQIQAVNSVLILLFVPLFTIVLYPLTKRIGIRPTPLRKIGLGLFLAGLSFAIIGGLEYRMFEGQTVSVSGQIWAYVALTAAEVLISMTCLEFAYTQAPNPAKSLVMGLYFLSLSVGNFLAVEVNRVIRMEVSIESMEQTGSSDERFSTMRFKAGEPFSNLIDGRKIMFSGDCGLLALSQQADGTVDTINFQGTFMMTNIQQNNSTFELLEATTRKPILLKGQYQQSEDQKVFVERLVGAEYFWFFSGLSILAGLLFIPIAMRYKTVHYIQEYEPELSEFPVE